MVVISRTKTNIAKTPKAGKVVRGEVVSHDDVNLVVDYGGEFLALAEPVLITSDEYCASNYRQLSRWVKKQAPVGSMVWLDTSRPTQDKGSGLRTQPVEGKRSWWGTCRRPCVWIRTTTSSPRNA